MLRKLIFGLVIASLSGALVYGGVHRTTLRSENVEETGKGRNEQPDNLPSQARNNGLGFNGNGKAIKGSLDGGGQNRQETIEPLNQNRRNGDPVREMFTITGEVGEINLQTLSINTDDGGELFIDNRAWSFLQENGFSVSIGDAVNLSGFEDEFGSFEPVVISNLSTGAVIEIRDAAGRPNWAGNGQGWQN